MIQPQEFEPMSDDVIDELMYNSSKLRDLPRIGDTIIGQKNAKLGIVLQHGFIGSNLEMMYLGNKLAIDGYRVLIPLLPGHGSNFKALHGVSVNDWVTKMQESVKYLQSELLDRKIVVVGHSLGGSLAIQLTANNPTICGLVTMAAPIAYPPPVHHLVKMLYHVKPNLLIKYRKFKFHDKRLYDHPYVGFLYTYYHHVSVKTLYQVIKVMEGSEATLSKIEKPMLVFDSYLDRTVWRDNGWKIFTKSSSKIKWFVRLDRSYHVVPMESDKEKVHKRLVIFLDYLSRT